jgi:hypothetical protein
MLVPIESYRDDLFARKANPRDIIVGAVTPDGDIVVTPGRGLADSCRFDDLAGTAAPRLTSFLIQFPDRHSWTTSCDSDWTDVLSFYIQIEHPIGYPCIEGQPLDRDLAQPGLQPEIAAWIDNARQGTSFVIPRCDARAADRCYRLVEDALNCTSTPTHLALTVEPPLFGYPAILNADIAVE